MTRMQRVAILVAGIKLLLMVLSLSRAAVAQGDPQVLRGRSLERVDASGPGRAQFNLEQHGEAVARMREAAGAIGVKLGASANGLGLTLIDETTEPGVQIIARRTASAARPATTSTSLSSGKGRRTITP